MPSATHSAYSAEAGLVRTVTPTASPSTTATQMSIPVSYGKPQCSKYDPRLRVGPNGSPFAAAATTIGIRPTASSTACSQLGAPAVWGGDAARSPGQQYAAPSESPSASALRSPVVLAANAHPSAAGATAGVVASANQLGTKKPQCPAPQAPSKSVLRTIPSCVTRRSQKTRGSSPRAGTSNTGDGSGGTASGAGTA